MELSLYLSILGISIVLSAKESPIPENLFSLFFIVVFGIHSAAIRFIGYDADIENYASAMGWETLNLYVLREPVVWIGQRYLFTLTGSSQFSFIVFDMLGAMLIHVSFRRMGMPQYSYFAFLVFFPFILGIQNIYRQWLAEMFFLFALSVRGVRDVKPYMLFLVSVLTHNVSGVFAPLYLRTQSGRMMRFISLLILIAIPAIIFLAAGTKSQASTGANMGFAYLLLIFMFVLFFVFTGRAHVKKAEREGYMSIIFVLIISASAVVLLSSAGGERVAMFGLVVLYPLLVLRIETRILQRPLLRTAFSMLGFFPLLLFGTREFVGL